MIGSLLRRGAGEAGLILSDEDVSAFELFAVELKKWNCRVNLTAITGDTEIAIKHFIDSLHVVPCLRDDDFLLDIGSGAGFPAIPLKIVTPGIAVLSVDAVAKKVNFQRHVIRCLGLSGITALHARAEELPASFPKKFSLITSRAFTRLDHFASLALPLLAEEGRLIAMKGADAEEEIAVCRAALDELGFEVSEIRSYNLPDSMGRRSLVMLMQRKPA